ncbi:ATP-dependent RNA helicase [Fictibacillus macauensis ZFHKF-1]|uniref:RNA helicase n=1 Tax=Fictibacillus macauensis ZFHKF-1 TaxID=1196324 RepID=I8ANF6_9BACL|nr:DEAD/DEAH box helicase [Fictibacillus macauensis]EIT87339.1 ATP-dependent RNA helicase [Fictibacillus macauensis ZFHKF-1]
MIQSFSDLHVTQEWQDALAQMGIYVPTPIQVEAVPMLLQGSDVIARSQTGTGKTMAFALPLVQRINRENDVIQALVVTPTRELAIQVAAELNKLVAAVPGIHVLSVYGGQDVIAQMHKLDQSVHIVVATPGRLLDHVRRGTIALENVNMLVLDEADQMLHIGFLEDVEHIIDQTSQTRQLMLFSATMPSEIVRLASTYMNNPKEIAIQKEEMTVKKIRQRYIETTDRNKLRDLQRFITIYRPYISIIFCRTQRRVTKLYEALAAAGYRCDELHGGLSQAKREAVMERFRNGEFSFLVATDVAARGLDVDGVTHVINYDLPFDTESYIHRIGRTGRAGNKGLAITFISKRDEQGWNIIQQELQQEIPKQTLQDSPRKKEERVARTHEVSKRRPKRRRY